MTILRNSILALCAFAPLLHAQSPVPARTPQPADVGAVRIDWELQHERLLKALNAQNPEIVFLGDSITAGWRHSPLFKEHYPTAFNSGVGGDSTQHVLWRVQHGAIDTKPRVVVLLIGINNLSNGYTPDQVASGISAILREIHDRSPATKILLLGILPRGEQPNTSARERVAAVNAKISLLANNETVFFLDMGQKFLQPDGTLTKEIAPDGLHLGPPGFEIWHEAMYETLAGILKKTP